MLLDYADWTFFQQGPGGPVGKNEEKATVLTEKIEDLVMQVSCLGLLKHYIPPLSTITVEVGSLHLGCSH